MLGARYNHALMRRAAGDDARARAELAMLGPRARDALGAEHLITRAVGRALG